MSGLNSDDAMVLGAVRELALARPGGVVPTEKIRSAVLTRLSYDMTGRSLRKLVDKGLLVRPKRGYYALAREETA